MNSEKVKEIKIVLKGLVDDASNWLQNAMIGGINLADILTLINELESENTKLTKAVVDNLDAYRDGFNAGASLKDRVDNKLKTENQQLKDRIALLEKDNELLRNAKVVYENVDYCYEDLKKAENRIAELEKEKTKTLKQFAERLKEKLFDLGNIVNENDIDETLKEFIK